MTPLKYPSAWRFAANPTPLPQSAFRSISEIIDKMAAGAENPKRAYEMVKTRFGKLGPSSDTSWAQSDMTGAMEGHTKNAPEFIAAFWMALADFARDGQDVPTVEHINELLASHNVGYIIDPPNLLEATPLSPSGTTEDPISKSRERYTLSDSIGRGSYGDVFKASRDSPFGAFEFAIKVHNPSPFTSAENALKRFDREVRALRKLQHRGIVPYLDAGIDVKGRPYLVMPFIDGKNLRDATSVDRPATIISVMVEVVKAIAYAHSENVLHRDLKPPNILVRASDQQPVIVDFGLAYIFDDATQESITTMHLGTGPYVPEEVIINPKERTVSHDIYSCGVILYELFARQVPQARSYVPLARRNARLAPVDTVVEKALAPVTNRFQSADELLAALGNIAL